MKPEQAAYVNLVALARADRRMTDDEMALLEEYRKVLGISKAEAEEIEQIADLQVVPPREMNARPADRLQIVKMMIRVGYADGAVTPGEKRLLRKVARSFGIGRIALSGLFWEIGRELGIQRRLRVSQIVAGATIVVAAVAIWIIITQTNSETSERIDAARLDFDRLKQELGLERSRADEALRKVLDAQEDRHEAEAALADRLKELEEKSARERTALKSTLDAEQKNQRQAMTAEIERLRAELARVRDLNATFQEIEKRTDPSILLILTTYDLVLGTDRLTQASMGTGFFVTSSGHIVTNKHVVQPWKFDADQIALIDKGAALDEASILMAAWSAGTDVKTPKGGVNFDDAFTTIKNSLRLDKTTPDTFVVQRRPLGSGGFYTGKFHTANSGDLALLKAEAYPPVRALPLEPDLTAMKKLDMVMVMGFPTGIHILETTRAATSPSLGEIRKIENSILVTAPIVPGNSGGPLIDARGNVAGVAAANFGDATLGSCIPAKHILPLLPTSAELLEHSKELETTEEFRAALDELRLADQRCNDDAMHETIGEVRARILEVRDEMIAEAQRIGDGPVRKKALEKIVDSFSSRWASEAVESLKDL